MVTTQTVTSQRIKINDFSDVVQARRVALDAAIAIGFPIPDATKIAVVVSELGRNIVLYAGKGEISLFPSPSEHRFKLIAQDQGPGIENIDLALTEGYTTSKGLGLGLSGAKRIMDEFEVWSVVGVGTRITAAKYL
ncbi:MAG: anti-sigma regulatory factor [Anaerolineae bacterium]|nr:anti-sigma regulatory factor [Anaerolineae bacterium]